MVSRSEGRHLMSVTSVLKEEMLDLLRDLKFVERQLDMTITTVT